MTGFGDQMRLSMRARGISLRALARTTHYDVGYLSKVMNGHKPASRALATALDTALHADGVLLSLAPPAQHDAEHNDPHPKEGDPTDRRDALRLGLIGTVAPTMLDGILSDAAAEAFEFTRLAGATTIGAGTLEHLEAAVTGMMRAYAAQPPMPQFAVARAYRRKVGRLIQGRHTLKEGRELYVYAGWLSELLAWLADDLGEPLTAEAYAIDAFQHGDQAGHDELCGWAMNALCSVSLHNGQPEAALTAALRGLSKASSRQPMAARLHAQAARAQARIGRQEECETEFAAAQDLYEKLPAQATTTFSINTNVQAAFTLSGFPASAYIWLKDFEKARDHAQAALEAHASTPGRGECPSREAIAMLDLGIALAELGSPDGAAACGNQALASPRVVDAVRARARDLDDALTARYPTLSHTHDFHDAYTATTRPAAGVPPPAV